MGLSGLVVCGFLVFFPQRILSEIPGSQRTASGSALAINNTLHNAAESYLKALIETPRSSLPHILCYRQQSCETFTRYSGHRREESTGTPSVPGRHLLTVPVLQHTQPHSWSSILTRLIPYHVLSFTEGSLCQRYLKMASPCSSTLPAIGDVPLMRHIRRAHMSAFYFLNKPKAPFFFPPQQHMRDEPAVKEMHF